MQRYFVNAPASEGRFYISGDDRHHIVRVMRGKIGDQIICSDSDGKSAICTIAEITDDLVTATVVQWEEGSSELPVRVAIASGLPKGDKLETIIQKGTELGAYQFIPFTAARSIVKWDDNKASKKVERWQKIAKEAAEQSHRRLLPKVAAPVTFKELLALSRDYDFKLIAYEEDAKAGESSMLSKTFASVEKNQSMLIVFGPEGGLADQEIAQLKEAGFISCGFGPRILRTETAPLYALAAVSYHFELMR